MFELKSVSKCFGAENALCNISMTIGSGLNFIIGASGSGKTTLLKILSGMDDDFDGEVHFEGRALKGLTDAEKAVFYNQVFGFVWQDFNLLDDRTVLENILLPSYLNEKPDIQQAKKLLRELKISELSDQKVSKLSGGQKQRVAIARELMKNPKVILADEPTSALDEISAKNTIEILRVLSKTRTVIVVTHDTSLIDEQSKVYELDKGELVSVPEKTESKKARKQSEKIPRLSARSGLNLGLVSVKHGVGRALSMSLALLLSATLLLVSLSGTVQGGGQSAFDELFETYGESLLDISLASSFISAGGTDGKDKNEPNVDVTQSLDGLFERYSDDPRVAHVLYSQAFDNIEITADEKLYKIQASGNVPVMNKLIAGALPQDGKNELAVPESFVKKMGVSNEDAIGVEIQFKATVYNWESGSPVVTPVETSAKISGVIDTNMSFEYDGQITQYSIDDSFFFSPSVLNQMREKAGLKKNNVSFSIRAKSPADMISLKDELNADGIVPLGRFELVEDMVRLNQQTTQQSGSATVVIGILSVVVALSVALIGAVLRKREYAIYKVSGFSKKQLTGAVFSEFSILCLGTSVIFLMTSPLLNMATKALWDSSIFSAKLLILGVVLTIGLSVLSAGVSAIIAITTNVTEAIRTGDR